MKKKYVEILLHTAFWSLFYFLTLWLISITHFRPVIIKDKEEYEPFNEYYFGASAITAACCAAFFYVNTFFILSKKYIRPVFTRIVASLLAVTALYTISFYLVPLTFIGEFCAPGEWDHVQRNVVLMFAFSIATSITYFFARDWYKNEVIRQQLQSLQVSTELNFLKSQINPHFLFNTLNNLFSIAQEKQQDELANYISKLSEMMRYMIYESNAEKVPVEKEIAYLKSFIVLNKLRYDDNEVKVNFSYPENSHMQMIAPMLLIPFVENAFKYGVLIGELSEINISLQVSSSEIIFNCENTDYSYIKKMHDVKGIGLDNVTRRLELLYSNMYELQAKVENGKHFVSLKLFSK